MPEVVLSKDWRGGFDNTGPDLDAPLRDAVNVHIDQNGTVSRRGGLAKLSSSRVHSLWSDDRYALCVVDGVLNSISSTGALVALLSLPNNEPVYFCRFLGGIVFSNVDFIGFFEGASAKFMGAPDAAAPGLQASDIGGMFAGVYTVVATYVLGGQEGAASHIAQVNVQTGGGIRLSIPPHPADVVRIYRSDANGDALYWAADIPAGVSSYLLGLGALGRLCETRNLRRMCGGSYVSYWNARLFVARGNVLHFSEPMNYFMTSPRYGFVQFEKEVTFIESVNSGVYVGQPDKVMFLSGSDPRREWSLTTVANCAPTPGSSMTIDAASLDVRLGVSGLVACWLCEWGFAIGTQSGQVVFPQQKRVRLPRYTFGVAVMQNDNRIITFTS